MLLLLRLYVPAALFETAKGNAPPGTGATVEKLLASGALSALMVRHPWHDPLHTTAVPFYRAEWLSFAFMTARALHGCWRCRECRQSWGTKAHP
jgi:hypothetical protein